MYGAGNGLSLMWGDVYVALEVQMAIGQVPVIFCQVRKQGEAVKTGSTPELSPERPEISVRQNLASATQRGALRPCQVFVPDFGTQR